LLNTRQRALQIACELNTELSESKERFQTILNSAAEGIYGVDLNCSCTFIVTLPGIEYKGGKTEIKSADKTKPEISEKGRIDKTGIKDLKGLVSELEGGFHNVYLSLEARQPISELKSFGQALMALGKKHSCNLIYDYGKSLSDSSDNFDIEGMLRLIRKYPENLSILKN